MFTDTTHQPLSGNLAPARVRELDRRRRARLQRELVIASLMRCPDVRDDAAA
jgi:hypothetical protein